MLSSWFSFSLICRPYPRLPKFKIIFSQKQLCWWHTGSAISPIPISQFWQVIGACWVKWLSIWTFFFFISWHSVIYSMDQILELINGVGQGLFIKQEWKAQPSSRTDSEKFPKPSRVISQNIKAPSHYSLFC